METEVVADGVLAQDQTQIADLWSCREGVPEILGHWGGVYKYDLSLPIGDLYDIVNDVRDRLTEAGLVGDDDSFPCVDVVGYGHMGDANLHLNIPVRRYDKKVEKQLEPYIYEWVQKKSGSISAEHGLGIAKKPFIGYSRSDNMIKLMKQIKDLYDPVSAFILLACSHANHSIERDHEPVQVHITAAVILLSYLPSFMEVSPVPSNSCPDPTFLQRILRMLLKNSLSLLPVEQFLRILLINSFSFPLIEQVLQPTLHGLGEHYHRAIVRKWKISTIQQPLVRDIESLDKGLQLPSATSATSIVKHSTGQVEVELLLYLFPHYRWIQDLRTWHQPAKSSEARDERRKRTTDMRDDKLDFRTAIDGPRVEEVDHSAGGVEEKLENGDGDVATEGQRLGHRFGVRRVVASAVSYARRRWMNENGSAQFVELREDGIEHCVPYVLSVIIRHQAKAVTSLVHGFLDLF